jgi:hypothetical protein
MRSSWANEVSGIELVLGGDQEVYIVYRQTAE